MDKQLTPCPFCGGEARIEKFYAFDGYQGESASYLVYCSGCDCILTTHKNSKEQKIIELWNRRVNNGWHIARKVDKICEEFDDD